MSWHPDEVELDAVRAGEGSERARRHVDGCVLCRRELALLESLGAALSAPVPPEGPIAVPPEQDAALAAMARAAVTPARRSRPIAWILPAVAAAAAVLLLLLWRGVGTDSDEPRGPETAAPQPRDVDGDGRVDILDAFALARTLEVGGATRAEWDFDASGAIDRADVDALAGAVVAITPRRAAPGGSP